MAKQATARKVTAEPIDRLENKIRRLIDVVTKLRTAQAKAADEQVRLTQELDNLRAQLTEADGASDELTALRQERDVISGRVTDILKQLDGLNI
jgi:regulator of replication initiation timing